jgi:amino acid permease
MNDSNLDEKGEPIPKDSVEIKDNNIPKESIKNLIQQKEEENQDDIKNNDNNEEIKNDQEENNDNNFPNPSNEDFDNYMKSNENTQKKEDLNDDFNKDNTFNEDNLNKNENNDNTFRISEVNNDNNRISDINFNNENNNRFSDINNNNQNNNRISDLNNNENNDNIFRDSNLNNENNNNYRYSNNNENQNKENENENGFDYEGDNNFNDNNLDENNNNNDHNNNNGESSNFGFRTSNLKDDNNNLENENNNNIRNSANSDKGLNNNNEETKKEENNNLRNRPNNLINQNKNNFNYSKNPYDSTNNQNYNNYNNYNQNGAIANTDINRTDVHFIPQDNNNYVNNLNTYGGNYNNVQYNSKHHPSYDPLYERYEELPEDSDGYHLDKDKEGKDSAFSAGVQIANTIMGAGILSIPTIMNYLGFLCGIIFVIFMAVSTLFSVNLLIKCHEITGKSGYSMFAKITMGTIGSILIKIIIIINNLGICICYFRIFGEVLQTIVQALVSSEDSFWVTNWHNYFYILIGSLIMLPFIFVKKISSLKKVAYLGVIFVLIFSIALSVLLFYKSASNKLDQDITWEYFLPDTTFKDAFHVMPTVFIAFLFQFNVFPIYYSMKKRNMNTMMKATKIGVGYSLVMFLIVGIMGFLLYGDAIKDTILDNFSDDMLHRNNNALIVALIIIICFSFIVTCLTSFPVLFFSLRVNYINSLIVCMKCCRKKNQVAQVEVVQGQYGPEKTNAVSRKAYIFITVCLYIFIIIFAILIYYLKTLFLIIGASAGTFIAFILPNFYYIMIVAKSGKNYNLILSYIYLGLGIFFFFIAILLAFF